MNVHGGLERSPIKKSWGEGVKMKELRVYMTARSLSSLPGLKFQIKKYIGCLISFSQSCNSDHRFLPSIGF